MPALIYFWGTKHSQTKQPSPSKKKAYLTPKKWSISIGQQPWVTFYFLVRSSCVVCFDVYFGRRSSGDTSITVRSFYSYKSPCELNWKIKCNSVNETFEKLLPQHPVKFLFSRQWLKCTMGWSKVIHIGPLFTIGITFSIDMVRF